MQDFPTLSHYLSLATHSPWGLVAVITIFLLFAWAVANKLFDKATGWVADFIGGFLGRIFRAKAPGHKLSLTPAQSLAKAIHDQLAEGLASLGVEVPGPLPVGWQPVSGEASNQVAAAASRNIATVYRNIKPRRLVILGSPGSGKSVLVQQLALGILEKHPEKTGSGKIRLMRRLAHGILGKHPEKRDYPEPEDKDAATLDERIPVIFGLHAWEPGTELDKWLTSQLVEFRYSPLLTEDLAAELVKSGQILPILDGFDETPPWLHAEIITQLNKKERPLVLTSRPDEYKNSSGGPTGDTKHHVVLANSTEIELTDLSPGDVADYLLDLPLKQDLPGGRASPARGARPAAWGPVAAELRRKRPSPKAAVLIEALGTPLMVAIARDIYTDEGDPEKLLNKDFAEAEEARKFLLRNFVPAIYSGTTEERSRWTAKQVKQVERAERAFHYLAAQAETREKSKGKWIAWWKFGGTDKKSAAKRALLCGLAAGLVMVVANGIATFAAVQGVGGLGATPQQGIVVVLGNSTAVAVAFGLVHWLTAWRASRGAPGRADWAVKPSWVGLTVPWVRGSRTAGNRDLAREFGFGFIGGSAGGGVAMLGLLLSSLLANAIRGGPTAASAATASPGLPAMLLTALGMTLIFGVTAGNVAALQAPVKTESVGGPLELLATDRRLALGGGAVAGVLSGAAIGCLIGLEQGPLVGLGYAAVACAAVWLGGAISATAWGQWLICGRLLLPLKGELPWRTRTFLRDAHKRGVLRQSGAFYQFRHPLLQERYAPTREAPPVQKAPSA